MVLENWSNTLKADLNKLSLNIPEESMTVPRLKEGERRVVSVLFADIKGFTAMSEKLDPEDVSIIIDGCFKILTGQIENYGGYIDKYEGDRIMALFGSHRAGEHDSQNALRAALGMKSRFLEINQILKERGIEIGIRIGVNTGLVVTGKIGKEREQDFTVMGDAVNLASRLESSAPINGILIEDETRKIAGEFFIYEPLGEIKVKGKIRPIKVFNVAGHNPKRVKRWNRLSRVQSAPFTGRKSELDNFKSLYRKSCKKSSFFGPIFLGVTGSAGIGKSRLVYEAIKDLSDEMGFTVPCMEGYSFSCTNSPYSIFITAIESFFKGKSEKDLSKDLIEVKLNKLYRFLSKEEVSRLKDSAPFFYYLLGLEGSDTFSSLDPKALSLHIKLSLKNLINAMAKHLWNHKKVPMILNLEDIQWADASSVSFLEYYAESVDLDVPIFIVLQYRSDFVPSKVFKKLSSFSEIVLDPLKKSSLLKIAEGILGRYVFKEKFLDRMLKRASGNPFYMEEIIYSLLEQGTIRNMGDVYSLIPGAEDVTLPDSISRIFLSRIDGLGEATRKILQISSVIGMEVRTGILKRVAGEMQIEDEELSKSISFLKRSGFLRSEGKNKYFFRNVIVRDVAYDSLLNSNKKLLHELVAAGIFNTLIGHEEVEENSFVLAGHYINAHSVKKALKYSLVAVKKALREYRCEDALSLSDRIMLLLMSSKEGTPDFEPESALCDVLEIKARVLDVIGMRHEQDLVIRKLAGIARKLQDKYKWLRVLAVRGKYYIGIADYERALKDAKEMQAGLDCTGKGSLCCEALRIMGLAYFNMGEYEKSLECFHSRLDIGRSISDFDPFFGSSSSVTASSHNAIGLVYFKMGRSKESLKYYLEAMRIMEGAKDKIGQGICMGNSGMVHWSCGDLEEAIKCYEASLKIFKETGYKKGIAVNTGNIGAIYNRMGKYPQALGFFKEAERIRGEIDDKKGALFDILNSGLSYRGAGDIEESYAMLSRARTMAVEQKNKYMIGTTLNELAETITNMDDSRLAEALRLLDESLELGKDSGIPSIELFAYVKQAKILMRLGRINEALESSLKAVEFLDAHGDVEKFTEEIFFNHYLVLTRAGREGAFKFLRMAQEMVKDIAGRIKDEKFRKSFLNNVRINREILAQNGENV